MSYAALAGGLLNPLTIPAHVLAWLSLGLLIGNQTRGRLIPTLCFAAGLAGGLAAITRAVGPTPALDLLLILSAVNGAMAALAIALPAALTAPIAAIAGLALGLDSPPRVMSLADAAATLIGTWVAACAALAVITTATCCLTQRWQRVGLRILGSWIAAGAMLVLALRFSRGMLFAM